MPILTQETSARYAWLPTPVGRLLLSGDERGLAAVQIHPSGSTIDAVEGAAEDTGLFRDTVEQLRAYFDGDLQQFSLTLNPQGTPFQQRVWSELQRIPFGETISYGELARRIGNPNACRAVGRANGANPIGIVIPCHRVIGGSGKLTGFAAGLDVKSWLLGHEAAGRLVSRG